MGTMRAMLEAAEAGTTPKGWTAYPSPDGKRMAYGRTMQLGKAGKYELPVRIIQDDNAGTAWRVDYHDVVTWVSMLESRVYKDAAAAAAAVKRWEKFVGQQRDKFIADGYAEREAIAKAREASYKAVR
jgi:hypothetical protein